MRYNSVKLDLFPIKKDLAFYLITRLIGPVNRGGGLEYKCRFTHSIIQMIYLIDKPCCKPKLKLYTLGIYIYVYAWVLVYMACIYLLHSDLDEENIRNMRKYCYNSVTSWVL